MPSLPPETLDVTYEGTTVLELDEFDEGTTQWSFGIPAADLDWQDPYLGIPKPLQVSLSVVRSIQNFSVNGTIAFEATGECYRCLAAATQHLDSTVKCLIQRKEASEDELEALQDQDDVEIVHPGTHSVDLSRRLRDSVMLELPMRIHCRPDCKGLCSQCGQDLNALQCACTESMTDPRWSALADLKSHLT